MEWVASMGWFFGLGVAAAVGISLLTALWYRFIRSSPEDEEVAELINEVTEKLQSVLPIPAKAVRIYEEQATQAFQLDDYVPAKRQEMLSQLLETLRGRIVLRVLDTLNMMKDGREREARLRVLERYIRLRDTILLEGMLGMILRDYEAAAEKEARGLIQELSERMRKKA